MTARLFDNEDWQRMDADAAAPSFLSDPASDMPGPSDVGSLVFQPDGPSYGHTEYQRPGRHAAPSYPPLTHADPNSYGSYGGQHGYEHGYEQSYQPPVYEPSYQPEASYVPDPRYDPSPRQHGWDPLTDPWPAEHAAPAGPAYPEPLPDYSSPAPQYVQPEGSWFREGAPSLPPQSGPSDISARYAALMTAPTPSPSRSVGVAHSTEYDVALTGPLGLPELGFVAGQWYSLSGLNPRAIAVRDALRADIDQASSIVQVTCWWMRENRDAPRAIDLATEMALAVSEFLKTGTHALR